jgi:hypothetical protein
MEKIVEDSSGQEIPYLFRNTNIPIQSILLYSILRSILI